MREKRRHVTVLAAVIALLLALAGSVAADRIAPGAPGGGGVVVAIDPPYDLLPVADEVPAPPAVARPKAAPAAPRLQVVCPAMPFVGAAPTTAAKAVVSSLKVYDRPDGRVVRTLANPTIENAVLNTLVLERRGAWLRVQLPVRPNGTSGWVFASTVSQYQSPYRVVVQRCAKRLTVFRNGVRVLSKPVAVGTPRTPTPTGTFYVDFVAPMNASGSYGPYLVSVAGFSEVLKRFGKNGIGQIAIHGTNKPSSIGHASSNGCVRMFNADLRELVKMLPEGSPVQIVD